MKKPAKESAAVSTPRQRFSIFHFSALISMPLLALSLTGCVPKVMYDRDTRLLNDDLIVAGKRIRELEADNQSLAKARAETVRILTDRYMELQQENKVQRARIGSFRNELLAMQRDIAELKLVITKNMEKIRSSMANEMLIKLIDMEHNVRLLLKKEAEPEPLPAEVLKDIEKAKEEDTKDQAGQQPQGGKDSPPEQ